MAIKKFAKRKKRVAAVETKPEPRVVNPIGAPVDANSVRQRVLSMMRHDMVDADIIATILEDSPDSKMNAKRCVYYRSTFANDKLLLPRQSPKGSKRFSDWFDTIDWKQFKEYCDADHFDG